MSPPDPARILIVDDHRPTRQSLCLLLCDVGYACTSTPSVREAREILAPTHLPPPALIIVDLWMPVEDGESLLRWIRGQAHLNYTRVAMYSAAPARDHESRLRAAGADDFIPKPTPIPQLLARLALFARPNTAGLPISLHFTPNTEKSPQ
ncbi:MAG TPA: response regulator [Tepidisphaeraceae bacterium]|jgi:DNA-binding response OmpR family regulator|nr:response regulator [Tepidisphaeraceae bacterium]